MIWKGPKSNYKCPRWKRRRYREENECTEKALWREGTGVMGLQVKDCHGLPRMAGSPHRWERRRADSPSEPPEGSDSTNPLISDLWLLSCEGIHFCCLRHLVSSWINLRLWEPGNYCSITENCACDESLPGEEDLGQACLPLCCLDWQGYEIIPVEVILLWWQ